MLKEFRIDVDQILGFKTPVEHKTEESVAAVAENKMKFLTIKTTARTMSSVAVKAAAIGASHKAHKVLSYRIIGTPTSASIYANQGLVCMHTPCTIYVFGNPDTLELEIRENKRKNTFSLAGKKKDQPIMVVLDK